MDCTFEAFLSYNYEDNAAQEGFGDIIKSAGKGILKILKAIWDAICRAFRFLRDKIKGFFHKISEEREKRKYDNKAFKSKKLGMTIIPDGTKEEYIKCKNCPDLTEIKVDGMVIGHKASWYFDYITNEAERKQERDRQWNKVMNDFEESVRQAQDIHRKYQEYQDAVNDQYKAKAEGTKPQDKARLNQFFDDINSKMDNNYNKVKPAIVEFKNSYGELSQMVKIYGDIKTDKDLKELSDMVETDQYYERGRQLSYISDTEFKNVEWEGIKITQSDSEIIDLFDTAVNDQSGELGNFITRSLKTLYEKIGKRMKDAEGIKDGLETLAKEEERTPHPTAKMKIKSALRGPMDLFTKIASMLNSDMNKVSRIMAYQE